MGRTKQTERAPISEIAVESAPSKKVKLNPTPFRFGVIRSLGNKYPKSARCFELFKYESLLNQLQLPTENEHALRTVYWSQLKPLILDKIQTEGSDLKSSITAILNTELHHGDILNFFDYRAVRTYIACSEIRQIGQNQINDFRLVQTMGEYGYYVPPQFSDVPYDCFFSDANCNLIEIFVDAEHTFPGSALEARIKEYLKEKNGDEEKTQDAEDLEHEEEDFFSCYSYNVEDDSWEELSLAPDEYRNWIWYYNYRMEQAKKEAIERSIPLLSMVLKPLDLPQGVVQTIAGFLF